jgi:hypothetical protein
MMKSHLNSIKNLLPKDLNKYNVKSEEEIKIVE